MKGKAAHVNKKIHNKYNLGWQLPDSNKRLRREKRTEKLYSRRSVEKY